MNSNNLIQPSPLNYYANMVEGGEVTVQLSKRQKAVILKAHDYGIQKLNFGELNILNEIVSDLKMEIWP